ncbi:MAG: hypothetical protein U0575_04490 [Phycisphaerales bacterium]
MIPPPTILILGPTAGGKTGLATRLARALPGGGVCIGADSMQVYRGMEIGTAKPTAEERAAAPHALIDLIEPDDDGFTVDAWLALPALKLRAPAPRGAADRRGRDESLVKAFLDGLFDGPPANAARDRLARRTVPEPAPSLNASIPRPPRASIPTTGAARSGRWRSSTPPGAR